MSGISISNGVLVVTDNQTTGTQPVVGQVSTPSQNSTSVPLNGSLSGTGSLTLSGSGSTTLSNETYLLEFDTNNQGQIVPAGSIVYKHILTNKGTTIIGDTANELSFFVSDSLLGFTTVIYYDANNNDVLDFADGMLTSTNFHNIYSNGGFGLDVNESITIFAKLLVPVGATLESSNNTILRATIVDVNSIEHSFFAENSTSVALPQDILPIANDDYATTDELTSVTVDVVANDFDFNGDILTLEGVSLIQGEGDIVVDGNNITVIPLSSAGAQQIQVSYNVTDGMNANSATLNVAVLSSSQSNQAPTPQQDSASVYEFGTIDSIDVLSNDSDPEDDALTLIAVSTDSGSAFINANNTISYTAGSAGIAYINYTVQDIFGNTAQSDVVVDVLGDTGGGGGDNTGGSAPIANDDEAITDEVTPISIDVIANDTDSDSSTLYLVPDSVHVEQGEAAVRVNGNSIEVIPISGAGEQEIVIYYAVADAPSILAANLANAKLYVTVTPSGGQNTPPVANHDEATVEQTQSVTVDVLANDTDDDGDTLTLIDAKVDFISGSIVVNDDQTITFTPSSNVKGQVVIDYVIKDSSGATAAAELIVLVTTPTVFTGNAENNVLTGTALDELFYGMAGDDTIYAGDGFDVLTGNEGNDYLDGGDVGDLLIGDIGDDSLYGQLGNDTLIGGRGNDYIHGGEGSDTYEFNAGDGQDTLYSLDSGDSTDANSDQDVLVFGAGISSSDMRFTADNMSNLVIKFAGTTDSVTLQNYFIDSVNYGLDQIKFADGMVLDKVAQAALTVYVIGDDNNNALYAVDRATHIEAGMGDDQLFGDTSNDTLIGGTGNDYMDGDSGSDTYVFNRGDGQDTLYSLDSGEPTDANSDQDVLVFGAGISANDIELSTVLGSTDLVLSIKDTTDKVILSHNLGTNASYYMDKIQFADGTMWDNTTIRRLLNKAPVLTGMPANLPNTVQGLQTYTLLVSDLLQGYTDANGDMLSIMHLMASHATVTDNQNGTYTLKLENGYSGEISLNYQVIDGMGGVANGHQSFNVTAYNQGTTGADSLVGGIGNDTFVVNNPRDIVVESANSGIDNVESNISYMLRDNLENLILTGSSNLSGTGNNLDNTLTGNDGNNRLLAGLGNDSLYGGAGTDTINGGEGADVMHGGTGNDTFTIENTNDLVVEFANEGYDSVNSFVTYTLTVNVERLNLENAGGQIDGFGNDLDNTLNGNNFANYLVGGAGNDTLQGKGGTDTLEGGLGDDVYYIDNVSDVVTELAGEGTDKVNSTVSYTLTANVEQLYLTGIAGLSGTGNAQNNIIYGNSGNNALNGSLGNDSLNGGLGDDTFEGGAGNDTLVGSLGNDIYRLGSSSDRDTIDNKDSAGNDILLLGAGIAADQVWLRQLGNDLEVSIIGTNNSAKVKGWYSTDAASKIDSIQLSTGNTLLANEVQYLVEAMAAFTPPSLGQTTLNSQQQAALATNIAIVWETITGTA